MSAYRVAVIRKGIAKRQMTAMLLGQYGVETSLYDCPQTFLDSEDAPPDCIVCGAYFDDIHETGGSLIDELARREIAIPVIIHTVIPELEEPMLELGAAAFVEDKNNFDELFRTIAEVIGRSESVTR